MKPLVWIGSSADDVRAFPRDARQRAGYELYRVQCGIEPTDWKAMASIGSGAREIRLHTRVEHRVIYIAPFGEAIYVLHAFEKKTGRTRPADIELARRRLGAVLAARKRKRNQE